MNVAMISAWEALGGAREALDALRVRGEDEILAGPLPCGSAAVASVGAALLAARELAIARGADVREVSLDRADVQASVTSERHVRVDGRPVGARFAPLSRWLRTADGWVRIHGNYPHHKAALMRALEITSEDPEGAEAAALGRAAEELEEAVFSEGGCAAALRSPVQWRAHPAGEVIAGRGLLDYSRFGESARRLGRVERASQAASGVRVLDLTRVIAGPVAGRTLAALGADVLRLDAPDAVELDLHVLDTAVGKRSARLDLRTPDGQEQLERLLAQADVVLQGYRPGALARLGLDPERLAIAHPHLAVVSLSAWGEDGPWGNRRGFDSLVQAGAGIATTVTAPGADTPGRLPAQLLDHGTGQLAAAAALLCLERRERGEGGAHTRLALARTAGWLLGLPRETARPETKPASTARTVSFGDVTLVAPPGRFDGQELFWTSGPPVFGADAPSFQVERSAPAGVAQMLPPARSGAWMGLWPEGP